MKDAFFAYPSGQMGMQKLKLTLNRNEKLGIAGTSGSGKSTLVKILLGLYEIQNGSFKVGDIDFYSISHEELMKNISVVLQETELFNISLRENITGMRDLDQKLLDQAIDIAQLREVVNGLPEGLDSLIGERGYMLSGGERQRLGIARAIYKNAPIMIFDEATSSLDSETEGKILNALFAEFGKEKTFLIIAHRLATLQNTDRVMVIEEGSVKEEGTFEHLSRNENSKLHQLYLLQNT